MTDPTLSAASSGPVEFDCCDCGRHIVQIVGPAPEPARCAACIWSPGWYREPWLRRFFEPDPEWAPPEEGGR